MLSTTGSGATLIPATDVCRGDRNRRDLNKSARVLVAFVLLNALVGGVVWAALPTVVPVPATGIGPFSAILNAFVNPNGESTAVTFEYSTDSDFEDGGATVTTVTADQSPVTGSTLTAVSKTVSGLTSGTLYFFRAVAVNGSGSVNGTFLSFATDPPPTVKTGIAGPVTTTTAQLNGVANANDVSSTVTFEYGTTTSYGTTVTADQSPVTGSTDTAVSKAISSLTPNTTYHFRVVGVSANGTGQGDDMTFFTSAQAAPTSTTEEATFHLSPDTATLNGTVNANNADATVTFEYGTTTSYGTTVTADESPVLGSTDTSVSKLISGLTADTTYHYRVVAVNSVGQTNGADRTFFNTIDPYAIADPPAFVTNTSATLRGRVNPKVFETPLGSTTVDFEYGETTSYGTTAAAIESPIEGDVNVQVSLPVAGLSPNTTYHYRVVANNANGTGSSEDISFTTSGLPTVVTQAAVPVGSTSATLNGTVNPLGDSTTVTFEYGTTTAYGTTVTADQSPVTGSTDTAVSKAITGLTVGTTYHYRAVGTNASGTVAGEDLTFTTGVSPPSVATFAATGIGTTMATLNGTINGNGSSTLASFEWGETTSYDRSAPAVPGSVSGSSDTAVGLSLGTLLPGTTYHFRAVGQSAGGTIFGADMSFTTAALPTVTTGIAAPVTGTTATLNGLVNASGDSTTVTFEYGTTTAYGTTVTADQSPVTGSSDTAVSKAIPSLTPSTTYHYRAVGTNSNGTSYGADMTFTTIVGAPSVTTNAATSVTSDGATLNAIVNANNASTTVTFEYGTTVAYGTTVTADQSPVVGSSNVAVSFTISGLTNNTTYHYRVVGTNASGTSNGSDTAFVTSNLPIATTQPATNVLDISATLNGTVSNNNTITFTSVSFEYGLTVGYGTTVPAAPSTVTGTSDTAVTAGISSLTTGTTYHFRVRGQSAYGTTLGSDMTFTTPIGPSAATNAATAVDSSGATLNGTVNANNANSTVTFEYGLDTSYGQVVSGIPSPVSGSANTSVSSAISSLIANTTYHYRVVASNANGTAYGTDMTFTTLGAAPTAVTTAASVITPTSATLNGTVNPSNDSTTVTFEYGTTTAYGTSVPATQSPASGNADTAVSAPITGLTTDATYHFRVVAQNTSGTVFGSDMSFFTGAAEPVVATGAASSIGPDDATLNGMINANNSATVVTFEFGETTAYGRTGTAAQSPVTGAVDVPVSLDVGGLLSETTYHYRVVGQSGVGTAYGADLTFTTGMSTAPAATTAAASGVTATGVILNGTVNGYGNSTTVTFEYGLDTGYGSVVTADQSPLTVSADTGVSVALTGLNPRTTYHYRVVAQSGGGDTNGEDVVFLTAGLAIPTISPVGIPVLVILIGLAGVFILRRMG